MARFPVTMGTLICFNCCFEDPQPKRPRRRIDPSMISVPTDFRHTAHVGSGDMGNTRRLSTMESQMSSKGGYDHVSPVNVHLNVIDLPVRNQT